MVGAFVWRQVWSPDLLIPDSRLPDPRELSNTDRAASISISVSAGHVFYFLFSFCYVEYKKVYANGIFFLLLALFKCRFRVAGVTRL